MQSSQTNTKSHTNSTNVSSHSKLICCKVVIETTLESHTNRFHLNHAHNTHSLTNSRTSLHLTHLHTKTTFSARSHHPHNTHYLTAGS